MKLAAQANARFTPNAGVLMAILHDKAGAQMHYQQGMALQDQGRHAEAVDCYGRAIKINPDYAQAHSNLGIALHSIGLLDRAVESYRRAVEIDPGYVAAHSNLGVALHSQGRLEEAVASYRLALKIKPDSAMTHRNLGAALQDLGQLNNAVASYRRVIELAPDSADIHCRLGLLLQELGYLEGAVECYRRAVKIHPGYAEAHSNLGVALTELGQLDSAVISFLRAQEIQPDSAEAHHNLGAALEDLGQLERALGSYRRALEIRPDYAETHCNLGLALLRMGDFEAGWRHYRARSSSQLGQRRVIPPDLPFAQWQGEPLKHRSIVIWPEQGLGDEIQFCRYATQLRHLGASRVTLVCKPPLLALFGSLQGVDSVLTLGQAGNDLDPHDFWTLLLDIPFHLNTRPDNIPSPQSYLAANPVRQQQVAALLAGIKEFKVGVCWKGSSRYRRDAERSFGPDQFKPLFALPGLRFFNLVPGSRKEFNQAAGVSAFDPGQETIPLKASLIETAALIMALDLVITCDTAVGHLAGALGKPVWLLLPFVSDWRWMERRQDSPWYPNTRLFRQEKAGDWSGPLERVRNRLAQMIAGSCEIGLSHFQRHRADN